MKKLIFVFLILSACSKSEDSKPANNVDPIFGEWVYVSPGATSTSAKGVYGKIEQDGKIYFSNNYIKSSNGSTVAYMRKNIGTFTREGDNFKIKYSYETCSPVKEETLIMKLSGDKLIVSNSDTSLIISMSRATNVEVSQFMAVVEDKDCNILSKLEKDQKRIPAYSKNNSFFNRVIK